MYVHDCEVLSLSIESNVAKILSNHQTEMITKTLELSSAAARVQVAEALAEAEQKENEVKTQQMINKMELQREEAVRKAEISAEMARKKEAEQRAQAEAENSLRVCLTWLIRLNWLVRRLKPMRRLSARSARPQLRLRSRLLTRRL